jgi:hypothetical protein
MKNPSVRLFLGTLLIVLAFLPPGIQSIDGYAMLQVADSIVTNHTVAVPLGSTGVQGKDGRFYSPWYPLQSILALPSVTFAVAASNKLHLPLHHLESFSVTILPALYTSLTVAIVYLLALSLGSTQIGAWLAALVYGFGTIALVYTRDFYADPLLALLVALAFLLTFQEKVTWWIVPVTALAVLAKPPGVFLGAVLSLYLLCRTRRFRSSALPGLGTAIGLCLYCFYNFYRFGLFSKFGHPFKFSIRYVPAGIAGLLFSPGGGLLWFTPCAFLSLVALWRVRTKRLEAHAIFTFAGAFFLLHCFWVAWSGGNSWGPRLLLPILPGLIALTALLDGKWRQALVALSVLTFILTAPNLVTSYKRYYAEAYEQNVQSSEFYWSPSRSLLLHEWPAALRQIRDARQNDVRQVFSQHAESVSSITIANSLALRIVSAWWWVLPVVHLSRVWGILVSFLLTILGSVLLVKAKPRDSGLWEPADAFSAPAAQEA